MLGAGWVFESLLSAFVLGLFDGDVVGNVGNVGAVVGMVGCAVGYDVGCFLIDLQTNPQLGNNRNPSSHAQKLITSKYPSSPNLHINTV